MKEQTIVINDKKKIFRIASLYINLSRKNYSDVISLRPGDRLNNLKTGRFKVAVGELVRLKYLSSFRNITGY